MTPEQIKELALAGVRSDTIKAISDELMNARRVTQRDLVDCEASIYKMMKSLESTYFAIVLSEGDRVEISFSGDHDGGMDVYGDTLEEAYQVAMSLRMGCFIDDGSL